MKRLITLLVVLALVAGLLALPVGAETTVKDVQKISLSESKSFTYSLQGVSHSYKIDSVTIRSVNGKPAYLLEPDPARTYSGSCINVLTVAQQAAIRYILAFGAPSSLYSSDVKTEYGYEVATQVIIWEIVMGLRSDSGNYVRSSDALYKLFSEKLSDAVYRNAFATGYKELAANLASANKCPSFASQLESLAVENLLDFKDGQASYELVDKNSIAGKFQYTQASGIYVAPGVGRVAITFQPETMSMVLPEGTIPLLGDSAGQCAAVSNGKVTKVLRRTSNSWGEAPQNPNGYAIIRYNGKQYAIAKKISIEGKRTFPAAKNVLVWKTANGYSSGPLNVLNDRKAYFTISLKQAYLPFSDVTDSDWFSYAVAYVGMKGLFNGVSETSFAPKANMSREQFATALYRMAGSPSVNGSTKFKDVQKGKWYYNAVLWAQNNKIINGVSDTKFGVGELLTREQAATILYRFAQFQKKDVSYKNPPAFPDQASVHSWANDAIAWATANKLISGQKNGTTVILNPTAPAKRCEIASILMDYIMRYE